MKPTMLFVVALALFVFAGNARAQVSNYGTAAENAAQTQAQQAGQNAVNGAMGSMGLAPAASASPAAAASPASGDATAANAAPAAAPAAAAPADASAPAAAAAAAPAAAVPAVPAAPPTRALPLPPQERRPLQPALAQRRLQQLRTDAADSRKFDQRRKPRDVSATSIAFVATDASARTVASRYTHRRPFLLPAPELDRDD